MFTLGVFVGISLAGILATIITGVGAGNCEYCGVGLLLVPILTVALVVPLTFISLILEGVAINVWSENSAAPRFKWGLLTGAVQLVVISIAIASFQFDSFSIGAIVYFLVGATATWVCLALWHIDRAMKEKAWSKK